MRDVPLAQPAGQCAHLLERANAGDRVRFLYGDLRDSMSLQGVVDEAKPDYVFHLAAQSYPTTSFSSPIDTYDTNFQGTARLLEVLRRAKDMDPVIHVCASSEVYGRVPKDKVPIGEECTFHPASPYAISKVGTDLIGRFHAEAYGKTVMTTSMFTHTGPRRGDVFAESTFAKQIAMIEPGDARGEVGNLNSMRTCSDVSDAVRAYHMLLTVNPQPGAYYNIGGDHSCTAATMLKPLCRCRRARTSRSRSIPTRLRPIDADLQIPTHGSFRRILAGSRKFHTKRPCATYSTTGVHV